MDNKERRILGDHPATLGAWVATLSGGLLAIGVKLAVTWGSTANPLGFLVLCAGIGAVLMGGGCLLNSLLGGADTQIQEDIKKEKKERMH